MSKDPAAIRQESPYKNRATYLLTEFSSNSLGDLHPQPPTPKQTPTSTVFPSPIFKTPNPNNFTNDSVGRTPRFADDYSVFNSTPGDLRGSQRPFGDFEQAAIKYTHKRLLSAESFAVQIASHVNHLLPNTELPLPPVEPSRRLASSPNSLTVPKEYSAEQDIPLSPDPSKLQTSAKKPRRGTITGSEPSQTATPPPTNRRGKRRQSTNLITMQNDQNFPQPDLIGASQHDLAALMAASGDMFGYPMTAPGAAPNTFWDPSMGMDLDFGASANVFQSTPASSHRHTGSFDWNSEVPLFQEPCLPMPQTNHEPIQPVRRGRPPASGHIVTNPMSTAANPAMTTSFAPMDDPFGVISPGGAVDPGMLFGRSMSAMDLSFSSVVDSGSAEAAIAESGSRSSMVGDLRRSSSVQDVRNTMLPDRNFAGSPVKSSRPGLGRSMSENRGKRGRPAALPKLAPAPHPPAPAPAQTNSAPNAESGRPVARPSGRSSPMKHQHRLSSLASIPEAIQQQQQQQQQPQAWRSVRLTIDSRGRARAEATLVVNPSASTGHISPRRPSRDRSRKEWDASDDDSDTDDEPIIIPSRTSSFNASFALPDPRKPVGSIFHFSKRSSSERSLGSYSNEGHGSQPEGENEAETVMNEPQDKVGDAASELRKVVEDRQKRSSQMGSARSQRFLQNNTGSFRGDTASPSLLGDAEGRDVRCVCHRNGVNGGDGFMVQCESCEMWLHGKCINMTRRTLPRVYICAFCANTPNMRGGRLRDTGRGLGGNAPVASPLANKSFRNFR